MAREYHLISGDSHMEVAPERWAKFLPEKYRELAPRTVKLPTGGDAMQVGDDPPDPVGLSNAALPFDQHKVAGVSFEESAGTGTPEQRVQEQDLDGVEAEVLFCSLATTRLWRAVKPIEASRAMFRAYNDFLGQEYCPAVPDRLFGLGVIPDTGIDDAVEELEHCKQIGLAGVILQAFPSGLGYPTPDDDRFWAAALDHDIPVTAHSYFSAPRHPNGPVFTYTKVPKVVGRAGGEPVGHMSRFAGNWVRNPAQLIFSGVFDRFPKLKIYFSETQFGWLPFVMEQLDDTYERSKHWAHREFGMEFLDRRPSEYVREHCYWGFLYDPIGARLHDEIGATRGIWGSDFPHLSGNWPQSRHVIEENFEGVSEQGRQRMLVGNVREFFHI
jgi:predicted TIM-barrel fold metal-dependent hydrolase